MEETLRYDPPLHLFTRYALEDLDYAGIRLKKGESVGLLLGAANRDPAAFERPDELWLARPDAARHLGYGHGLHFCLGAPLARLETQVALAAFASRLGPLQLAVDPLDLPWGATILGRGLQRLPVAWEP